MLPLDPFIPFALFGGAKHHREILRCVGAGLMGSSDAMVNFAIKTVFASMAVNPLKPAPTAHVEVVAKMLDRIGCLLGNWQI